MTNPTIPDEVNIGDILRLALPLKTLVMAGARHARRNVGWVVVLTTWRQLEEQVKEHDLVIVPASLHSGSSRDLFEKNLKTLAGLSVAGLLGFGSVPEAIGQMASELDLPLLIAPEETAVRDVHRAIASLLVDRQSATSERGLQMYRQLAEMSREGQGIQAMTDFMANLTGKIVVVQDKRLDIQAISYPHDLQINVDEMKRAIAQRDELPAILRNRKAAARARQSHWQQMLTLSDGTTAEVKMGRVIAPIISGDRARGYLSVVGVADELDLLDSLVVEYGAAAYALEMAKAKAVSEAKKSLRGDFLEGVLAGTLPPQEMERLSGRLDHDTQQPHAILTFTWVGKDAPSPRNLETTLNWLLHNHNRPALVHIYGGKYVVVFQALKDSSDMESAQELGRRLREQIEAEHPDHKLIGGISGPAHTLTEWPTVYSKALQAMQLGQRLKLSNRVVDFDSLGIFRLLAELENIPAVQRFTDQVIGPLADYDREHRGSLIQTLDAYFAHHANISQTAESLFVHRNTLLYRLDRIQELTQHDLNQSDMRLALHLALKFWLLRPEK
jgi:PucR family transcriptional regulator, purine catabolism regulatory protein